MGQPIVGVIVGSESDLPVMKKAVAILDLFAIDNEIKIVSAHRTPARLVKYSTGAKDRGLKVVIAGAGGAAHLPGMVASMTILPVIGVPIQTRSLSGIDSLLSIVQMPPGVPVATMAINGAENAAILAAKILSIENAEISNRVEKYIKEMENTVIIKSSKLEMSGVFNYLAESNSGDNQDLRANKG